MSNLKYRENLTAIRPRTLGWKPQWDRARFLKNVDNELSDVLELGKPKSSLIDSLSTIVGDT